MFLCELNYPSYCSADIEFLFLLATDRGPDHLISANNKVYYVDEVERRGAKLGLRSLQRRPGLNPGRRLRAVQACQFAHSQRPFKTQAPSDASRC